MDITLREFATKYNTMLTRRHKRMSESYLYRLIREDIAGVNMKGNKPRELWFKYTFVGDKDSVRITINK